MNFLISCNINKETECCSPKKTLLNKQLLIKAFFITIYLVVLFDLLSLMYLHFIISAQLKHHVFVLKFWFHFIAFPVVQSKS